MRSFSRLGSSLSVYGISKFGSSMSLLDFFHLGSTVSFRSFVRIGIELSDYADYEDEASMGGGNDTNDTETIE